MACDRYLGPRLLMSVPDSVIELLQLNIFPRRLDACSDQQEAQHS